MNSSRSISGRHLFDALESLTPARICGARTVQGNTIGDGSIPGPITKALQDAYIDLVNYDWVSQYMTRLED